MAFVLSFLLLVPATARTEEPSVAFDPGVRRHPAGATAIWVDVNLNGKRDRSEKKRSLPGNSSPETFRGAECFGDRAADEILEETVDNESIQKQWSWTVPVEGDDQNFVDPGTTEVVTRYFEITDRDGRLVAQRCEPGLDKTDSYDVAYEYGSDGREIASTQTGPGNVQLDAATTLDESGRPQMRARRSWMGVSSAILSRFVYTWEGRHIVRVTETEFSEEDGHETATGLRITWYEYDGDQRVRARRTLGLNESGLWTVETTFYEYD